MANNTFHEKEFFDLSGSLPFSEQQALARWYTHSLVLITLAVVSMFVFSGRALYENFWSLSPVPELLPESLEEIRTRYTQKTELYNQHESYNNTQSFSKTHERIHDALNCVVDSLPVGVQLSTISFENNKVMITGLGENLGACMEFIENLKNNNCFKEYVVHTITWHPTESHLREVKISFLV